jgi:hypothetical protein
MINKTNKTNNDNNDNNVITSSTYKNNKTNNDMQHCLPQGKNAR